MLQGALQLGIFCAALALAAAGLSGLTLPPGDAIVDDKLAWWRAHAAEYDTLIIGTSRLYHGVIPKILDATAAERGRPIRSFNLAVDGLRPPEDDFVLEKALAAPRLKLRWVIVECNELKLQVTDLEHESARDVYWHDLPRLRILWRRSWATSYGDGHHFFTRARYRSRNLAQFTGHTRLWLWRCFRPGAGIALIKDQRELLDRPHRFRSGPLFDGYEEQRAGTLLGGQELRDYEKMLHRLLAQPPRLTYGDPESQADLCHKRDLIESVGAQMVLVRPPYLAPEVFAPISSIARVPFFDFSDPGRFPELYAVEMRRDYGHTNARGSAIFSRMLAENLSAK